jgi:hypothetical protein
VLHGVGAHDELAVREPSQHAISAATARPTDQPSACIAVYLAGRYRSCRASHWCDGYNQMALELLRQVGQLLLRYARSLLIDLQLNVNRGRLVKLFSPSCRMPTLQLRPEAGCSSCWVRLAGCLAVPRPHPRAADLSSCWPHPA